MSLAMQACHTIAFLALLAVVTTGAAPPGVRTAWQISLPAGVTSVDSTATAPPTILLKPGVTTPSVAVLLNDTSKRTPGDQATLSVRRLDNGAQRWSSIGPSVKARDHSVATAPLINVKALNDGEAVLSDYYLNHSTTQIFKGFSIFNSESGALLGVQQLSPYASRTVSGGRNFYLVEVDPASLATTTPVLTLTRYGMPDFTRPAARFGWSSTQQVRTNGASQSPLSSWTPDLLIGQRHSSIVHKLADVHGQAWVRRVDPLDLSDLWRVRLDSIQDDVWIAEDEDLVLVSHGEALPPFGFVVRALAMRDGSQVWEWRTDTDLAPSSFKMAASVTKEHTTAGGRQFCGIERLRVNFDTFFEVLLCIDPAEGPNSNATALAVLSQFNQPVRELRGSTGSYLLLDDRIASRLCALGPFVVDGLQPGQCLWTVPAPFGNDIEYLAVSADPGFIVAVSNVSLARWDLSASL